MRNMTISPFQVGQEIMISELIRKVYDEFVAPDYSVEGNHFFYDWIEPCKIKERQKSDRIILVAWVDEKMAGMIEIRDNNRISLLFTDKDYQGRGIAKSLFQESLKICIQKNPSLSKFYVHASPYSVPIYQRLGFVAVDEMHEQNGLKYLPMERIIS